MNNFGVFFVDICKTFTLSEETNLFFPMQILKLACIFDRSNKNLSAAVPVTSPNANGKAKRRVSAYSLLYTV